MNARQLLQWCGAFLISASLVACGDSAGTAASQSSTSVTPPPAAPPATASTIAMSQGSFNIKQSGGTVKITVARTAGDGEVGVSYATANGTAIAGTDYTSTSGTLTWAADDMAAKTFNVAVSGAKPFTGTRTFQVKLTDTTGSAALGTPASASIAIAGSGTTGGGTVTPTTPGSVALSAAAYSVAQNAGKVTVTAARTGGSDGAVAVTYATANMTAAMGSDYSASNGTLNWAAGDAATKTFSVNISNANPFVGSKTFSVTLSGPTGGAALGSQAKATVSITGDGTAPPPTPPTPPTPPAPPTTPTGCAKNSSSWQSTSGYGYKQYGNYVAYLDNWGGLPGQNVWINSVDCWGATASTSNTDFGYPRTYPHFTRGWSNDGSIADLSTAGSNDWTTKSGMGIQVGSVTKAKLHWAFQAPLSNACAPYCRWDALADVYFHTSANPDPSQWPPYIDMQIIQQQDDQVTGSTTWNASVASSDHGSTVTIGGNTYVIIVDDPGGSGFHQSGGHLITLLNLPTAFSSDNANPNWGVPQATHDIAAIIRYLMQSNPRDDAGNPLHSANGNNVTSPLLTSNLYLSAVNAGWEINAGSVFNNTALCIAMQNEPDCP